MKPLVSIVIINWNGREVIQECLTSVYTQHYPHFEVILLDNNSSDDSFAVISEKFNKVRIIRNPTNDGFAKGNNIACKKAKGKYILLLNSDAFLTVDCLDILVSEMEKDKSIGVMQPKILYKGSPFYPDESINSIGSLFTSTGFLYHPGYGKNKSASIYNNRMEVFTAFGACMLIKHQLIKNIGLFDEDYFAYFEESDFCSRAWLTGERVVYIPHATAYHRGGVSARKYGLDRVSFHSFKNRINSYLKNLELKTILAILPLHIILCEGIALNNFLMGRFTISIAIQRAIWWNISQFRETLKKRSIIQSTYRKISDDKIFSKVKKNPRLSYYLYLFKGLEYYKD